MLNHKTSCYLEGSFENLLGQGASGDGEDSCGKRVLGETPQGCSLRRLTALPRKATHPPTPRTTHTKISKLSLPQLGAYLKKINTEI